MTNDEDESVGFKIIVLEFAARRRSTYLYKYKIEADKYPLTRM
jgi:hypothetical protein